MALVTGLNLVIGYLVHNLLWMHHLDKTTLYIFFHPLRRELHKFSFINLRVMLSLLNLWMNGRLCLVTKTQVHQLLKIHSTFFVPQLFLITNNLAIEQEIPSYIMYLIAFWQSFRTSWTHFCTFLLLGMDWMQS